MILTRWFTFAAPPKCGCLWFRQIQRDEGTEGSGESGCVPNEIWERGERIAFPNEIWERGERGERERGIQQQKKDRPASLPGGPGGRGVDGLVILVWAGGEGGRGGGKAGRGAGGARGGKEAPIRTSIFFTGERGIRTPTTTTRPGRGPTSTRTRSSQSRQAPVRFAGTTSSRPTTRTIGTPTTFPCWPI